jgi:redox-sensitive bicupin YhaK (pirin superfamily)
MSFMPAVEPASSTSSTSGVAAIIDARARDLGGFKVRRLLPSRARRLVGPFVFFDHMGPVELGPGEGLDVPPHPHIGLATVTYLFDGELIHRDSLGSFQPIEPGEINWMTAGRGIVHSERTGAERRRMGSKVHGLQLWVALPKANEEMAPAFHHYAGGALPEIEMAGAHIRVLAGTAYGGESQVQTLSPLFCADVVMQPVGELRIPNEYEERAAYVVEGVVGCGVERAASGRMLVFAPQMDIVLRAETAARIVLLGGAPMDGQRHIWWNFVSSSQERIEQAKRDWKQGRFPNVPGDEVELVPLPE